MQSRSRLSRRTEQKAKQKLFFTLVAIVLFLVGIFKLGIPLLVQISDFFVGAKGDNSQVKKQDDRFIAPPVLNPLPVATNSAPIMVSGVASKDQTVVLYVNDEVVSETNAKDDRFEFKEIPLKDGENTIKAKALKNNKPSDFSDEITIVFDKEKPTLKIEFPQDGQSFSKDNKTITIKGKTDQGSRVTVNGFWAIVNTDGSFSYNLTLQQGENTIKAVSIDEAGNKSETEYKVTYNP